MMRIRIVITWSWKKINSSIKGEHAFWKLRAENEEIFKGTKSSYMKLKFSALICHIKYILYLIVNHIEF